jgi:hypothetical protein
MEKAFVVTLAGKKWHAPKLVVEAESVENALNVLHGEIVKKITSHGGSPVWLVRCERRVLQEFAPHLNPYWREEMVEVRIYEVPLV